jgi:formylglycine-generating enzyme required for sulfatase activity
MTLNPIPPGEVIHDAGEHAFVREAGGRPSASGFARRTRARLGSRPRAAVAAATEDTAMTGLETTESVSPLGSSVEELAPSGLHRVGEACERFEAEWRSGCGPSIEQVLGERTGPERRALLRGLLALELSLRRVEGATADEGAYLSRFPAEEDVVRSVLEATRAGGTVAHLPSGGTEVSPGAAAVVAPPRGEEPTEESTPSPGAVAADHLADVPTVSRTLAAAEGRTEPSHDAALLPLPARVGRYTVIGLLGKGGFGLVYHARDEDLGREVAVKVPRAGAFATSGGAEAFLREARLAASLKHPAIVTVHDVGLADDGTPFVVFEYVEGMSLGQKLLAEATSYARLAELIVEVAEALAYAHERDLVHRDLKPANLLIDGRGRPHIADFGLAVHEPGRRPAAADGEVAGTPHYMAPEQVRGESHRLDGRTDIWGLGVVLYQMLTHRLPFTGRRADVFDAILHHEPRPPRQLDPGIPRELERVCLKCLSKRMSDRYSGALELAADLRFWLAATGESAPCGPAQAVADAAAETSGLAKSAVRVIPKGLRSFDAADTDFFLSLLPGPVDRDGLPEALRFWKTRVEAADPDEGFTVGLLYGPSGCGKSSLVKAGLIPHLAPHVRPVYIEATPDGTDARLSRALRKAFPGLPTAPGLADAMLSLREGPGLRKGRKVLLVIDQFEQWLHAPPEGKGGALVEALRQCDGAAVQCLLLVRDDFGMAAMRFMNALEVPVVEGKNLATVDRFDVPHAAEVLALFGRALGRLPAEGPLATDQRRFLDQAAEGMAEEGKVAPVRLALFAEMFRGAAWNPASLKRVGGAEGIGMAFLEEALGSSPSSPRRRLHAPAARAVLKALLPDPGVNIKGHMRSDSELQAASGYAHKPRAFEELLAILDGELRLITPCDPERSPGESSGSYPVPPSLVQGATGASGRWFQLTHDYLVGSLRKWLTRKQSETMRGRAELLLDDRAAVWSARPERRYLPSLADWLRIAVLTRRSAWNDAQCRMMRAARVHHASRLAAASVLTAVVGVAAATAYLRIEHKRRSREADVLMAKLLVCQADHIREAVDHLAPFRGLWESQLAAVAYDPERSMPERTRAHLALVESDGRSVRFLVDRLLAAEPEEHAAIRSVLSGRRVEATARVWNSLHGSHPSPQRLVRAAAALAAWVPVDPRWEALGGQVARALAAEPFSYVPSWSEALRPVAQRVSEPLSEVCLDERWPGPERLNAAVALRTLGGDELGVRLLVELLKTASDPGEFRVVVGRLALEGQRVWPQVRADLYAEREADADDAADDRLALRRANAALAMIRLGDPGSAWPLLRDLSAPAVRDQFIHRAIPCGVEASTLLDRLRDETDPVGRQALVLALGAPASSTEGETLDSEAADEIERLFRTDPEPGVHAAAEWLLHRLHGSGWAAPARDSLRGTSLRGWSVNGQGLTMVHVAGPVSYTMGSNPSTPLRYRERGEVPHVVRIERGFAISAHEVTVSQFLRYSPAFGYDPQVCPESDGPITKVMWYDAARYCRWLSEQEHVAEDQMCYPPMDQIGDGMTLPADFLERTGYRLPTEAEWEFAARAGTTTAYFFGDTPRSLKHYAWLAGTADFRLWPCGLLKPNALGLFDVYGNAREWCHDVFAPYAEPPAVDVAPHDGQDRVNRGGGYRSQAREARSSLREPWKVTTRFSPFGFRVARTLPSLPSPPTSLPPRLEP